ncbi:fimbrillin family protein [Sphingobacterium yanglingense]|uniref:Uncharacterized protein n=1 Tax=Sphingobacterium yanglingense TaxID=1437280 RepID=A0A4R6WDN5_9SPHI|nr:hypothetical protein [Sphingobacterium yanglingense]TDQ77879.1 hypothetical protein CLV99_1847 [Sphingobacterium yanglingense]
MRTLLIIRKNLFRGTFYFNILLLLVSIALITSCSKTKEEAVGETIDLIVKVEGVDSDVTMPNTKSSARSNYVLLPTDEEAQPSTVTKDDVTFISKSEVEPDKEGFALKKDVYATKSTPMDPGIKYRLLVYTMSNVLVSSVEVTAGQAQRISVTSGTTYKWRAYSYNTSDAIPAPNPSNPEVMTPTATTLLYAKGEITPTAPSNILAITFKHQLTQLRVVVKDGSGFRSVLSVDGQIGDPNLIKTSAFDLLAGEKKAGTTVPANVSTLDFAPETVEGVTRQVARCYTSDQNIASYGLWINSMKIQYTSTVDRTITDGGGYFTFGTDPWVKTGYILQGTLDIVFRLPTMRILPFSNNNASNGYRLAPATAAGAFLREPANFGPNSKYVGITSLTIDAPTTATEATSSSTGWNRFKALMTNPATYPDVLIVASWYNYLDDACWDLVKQYIDRGGNVLYTHDDANLEGSYAGRGIGNIMGSPVSLERNVESYGVYKFTDTPAGEADLDILNGPFGDARPYHLGQDRIGTSYVTGYNGPNAIVYSNHAQNKTAPSKPGMVFFRHKTKSFFFVGDGGFYLNEKVTAVTSFTEDPFRFNPATKFPALAPYGQSAVNGSPAYGTPGTNVNGGFTIANSIVFGNMMAWMLNRAHYHGINRN